MNQQSTNLKNEDLQLNVQNISKNMWTFMWKMRHFYLCTLWFLWGTPNSWCTSHGHFGKLRKQEPCLTKRFTRFREISFFKISRDCCLHTSSKCISEWRKLTQRNRHHYTENEVWLAEIEAKYMAPLKKKEEERTCTIFEIAMNITDLKKLLNSNNASLVSPYKSRNVKFRKLPLILTISLTSFIPKK